MPNMSYCRFQNTANDLMDCWDNFDADLTGDEFKAREQIRKIAEWIVEQYGDRKFEEKEEIEGEYEDEE